MRWFGNHNLFEVGWRRVEIAVLETSDNAPHNRPAMERSGIVSPR